jgi:hypothetical protein
MMCAAAAAGAVQNPLIPLESRDHCLMLCTAAAAVPLFLLLPLSPFTLAILLTSQAAKMDGRKSHLGSTSLIMSVRWMGAAAMGRKGEGGSYYYAILRAARGKEREKERERERERERVRGGWKRRIMNLVWHACCGRGSRRRKGRRRRKWAPASGSSSSRIFWHGNNGDRLLAIMVCNVLLLEGTHISG